jgi:hypothetical protein
MSVESIFIESEIDKVLANFLSRYTATLPKSMILFDFVRSKTIELEVRHSLQLGYITEEEVTDLLLGHLFTKFAKDAVFINDNSKEQTIAREMMSYFWQDKV